MADTADVVIVGGGMAGIGLGAHLAPHARVVLMEREAQPGYHASGRSAAIFLKNYGNPTVRTLTRAGEALLANPPGDLAESPLLSPRGMLTLAAGEEIRAFETFVSGALGAVEVSIEEAFRRVPVLRPGRFVRAAIEEDAPDIDVHTLLHGWLRIYRRHGGVIHTNAEVMDIAREAGGAWQITTKDRTVSAPVLVNAAGAWADAIAALAGVPPLGLRPLRRSAAIIPAPEGQDVSRWPLFGTVSETWYAKPDAGRLMISPADEDEVEPHDAWPDDMVLAEGLDRFSQATTVEVRRLDRSWAGLRTFAPDRTPVAGFDPVAEGFFWLAGQGGYGIQTSPALSQLASALILGQEPGAALLPIMPALSPARLRA